MYTNCPECGTVFRISTTDLRVAEGYVRCGHCAATFNALASLSDQLPPTVTLQQLTLPTESDPGESGEPDVAVPESEPAAESPPQPGFLSDPPPAADPQALEAAVTYVPLPISEDTLEFDIPEDNWSSFFEGSAPVRDPGPQVSPGPEPAPEVDADWQGLLSEVQDDEDEAAPEPEPVYVISEEPRAAPADSSELAAVLPEPAWYDSLESGTQPPAPLPADLASDLAGSGDVGASPGSEPEPDPGPLIADRPFLWTPPVAPATLRSGRHRAYTAGSVLLALLLVMQVLHQQRDELATNPALTEALQRTYATLGLPLWPAWDLRAYQVRSSEAVTDRSSPGALDILARIVVVGDKRVGLPFVRVTLRDGFARPLGSRVFQPAEYLGKNPRPREPVSPGTLIPVEINLQDPGRGAQGFDVDVCVMTQREGMICRAEREPFVR